MKIKSNTTTTNLDVSVSIRGLRQKKMELILLPWQEPEEELVPFSSDEGL